MQVARLAAGLGDALDDRLAQRVVDSVISTDAPSRARVSEQASPMPEAPPVTMATLPES